MVRKHGILIAKILIFISFILFASSIVVYVNENKAVVNPKESKSLNPNQEEVNITSKGNNDLELEDDKYNINTEKDNSTSEVSPPGEVVTTPNQDTTTTENKEENYNPTPVVPQVPQVPTNPIPQPSITELNNNLRNTLQNNYGITILYGEETNGYRVGGLNTNVEYNEYTIQSALNDLNYLVQLYPFGFFQEIKNGGIPLTLYLIDSYSTPGVTGATNAFNNRADISISLQYSFAESFNHEVFHYMEKYIKKNGDNFNSWSSLNPLDFKYGNINGNLSYNRTFSADAPFVNNYAQSSAEEDRASTFEYMMGNSKASCLNNEKTVWRKAEFLAQKIDLTFNTVSPNITEYWERFIY